MAGIGGFARNAEGLTIGRAASEALWLPAAREVLTGVAGSAYGLITQADFAEAIEASTGVHANPALAKWLGPFLVRAAEDGLAAQLPPLVSLVVEAGTGKVGPAYDAVLVALGRPEPATGRERERVAADDRIACYRWAGAPEPAGGWYARPAATGRSTPSRTRRAPASPRRPAAAAPQVVAAFCPRCFMQLPATGVCDDCG